MCVLVKRKKDSGRSKRDGKRGKKKQKMKCIINDMWESQTQKMERKSKVK